MSTNDHGRKEPSLADLEAFEKLLSQTLHDAPVPAPAAPKLSSADQSAMAELTRLIEQPLDFAMPTIPPAPQPAEPPALEAALPAPQLVEQALSAPLESHAHIETGFSPDWPPSTSRVALPHPAEPELEAPPAAPQPPALDPLAAFEEELRRFDASRLAIPEAPALPPELPPVPAAAQAVEEHVFDHQAQPFDHQALVERQRQEEAMFAPPPVPEPPPYAAPPVPQPSALELAEQRLADEAAAASYGEGQEQGTDVKRSKGVFMALGGLAVAGLAVIGGTFMFSGSPKPTSGGDVPVIAAKREPTKEKPADPGGVEIPNQDAKVLAGRNATQEASPAKQVVNTTEQPMDLREVTRRESVRVIAPNPYQSQGAPTPTAESAKAAEIARPAEVEQRRVTSVRVPVGGDSAAPSGGPNAAALAAGAAAGAGALAAVTASRAAPKADVPKVDAPKAAPKAETPAPRKVEAKVGETKVETPKATPTPKVANASATPKVKAPDKKAPMSLTGDGKAKAAPAAPAAVGGAGTYAVQLASRPTEADARSAASSLGSKFSSQLGGKSARVVAGQANGQTVYRVRAGGYSQASATEACNRIKAAGGNCFIAKQ